MPGESQMSMWCYGRSILYKSYNWRVHLLTIFERRCTPGGNGDKGTWCILGG